MGILLSFPPSLWMLNTHIYTLRARQFILVHLTLMRLLMHNEKWKETITYRNGLKNNGGRQKHNASSNKCGTDLKHWLKEKCAALLWSRTFIAGWKWSDWMSGWNRCTGIPLLAQLDTTERRTISVRFMCSQTLSLERLVVCWVEVWFIYSWNLCIFAI